MTSPTGEPQTQLPEELTNKPFVKRIIEYKEVLAICVFFFAGLIWLYSAFATKVSVAKLECLLGSQTTINSSSLKITKITEAIEVLDFKTSAVNSSDRNVSEKLTQRRSLIDLIDKKKKEAEYWEKIKEQHTTKLINKECG